MKKIVDNMTLKMGILAFRTKLISVRKRVVDKDVVNDATYTHQSVITLACSYDFYDMPIPKSDTAYVSNDILELYVRRDIQQILIYHTINPYLLIYKE